MIPRVCRFVQSVKFTLCGKVDGEEHFSFPAFKPTGNLRRHLMSICVHACIDIYI